MQAGLASFAFEAFSEGQNFLIVSQVDEVLIVFIILNDRWLLTRFLVCPLIWTHWFLSPLSQRTAPKFFTSTSVPMRVNFLHLISLRQICEVLSKAGAKFKILLMRFAYIHFLWYSSWLLNWWKSVLINLKIWISWKYELYQRLKYKSILDVFKSD